jgi:hypothetical protein
MEKSFASFQLGESRAFPNLFGGENPPSFGPSRVGGKRGTLSVDNLEGLAAANFFSQAKFSTNLGFEKDFCQGFSNGFFDHCLLLFPITVPEQKFPRKEKKWGNRANAGSFP